jgi:hypothetical protein
MRRLKTLSLSASLLLSAAFTLNAAFRPPAVPLITHDPYFSVWSMADRLTDEPTRHWTGVAQSMTGLVRIDSKTFRFMGSERHNKFPALGQTSVEVLPTRTIYQFSGAGIDLTLTFLTPSLPADLDVLSRPVTYLIWDAKANDAREHAVQVYFDASTEIAVNTPDEPTNWSRYRVGALDVLRAGSQQQPVLQKSGDNVRIDWGYFYLAAPPAQNATLVATDRESAEQAFSSDGKLPDSDDLSTDTPQRFKTPALASEIDFGQVSATPISRHLFVAYDDRFAIEYLHRRLQAYWRRNGDGPADLLRKAERDYASLRERCEQFDAGLMADLRTAGGDDYARLCALAFRQTLAAHKLTADIDGTPLLFSKENFSNGSIDTVDVTYPSSPFFLLFNPKLLEAQLRPILDYAGLSRWRFPFAPHDLGRYPIANGQKYGGGEASEENQMPVEESGNMLIMAAATVQTDGDTQFAEKYWPLLTKWAEYLKEKGLDPGNQLCTDDFAGHLAHNANLSIKAIEALGAYSKLAAQLGKSDVARAYETTAKDYAKRWVEMANDGDHYRLAFDRPGTWSQKYNLVWDNLLGLHLFPASVVSQELAYYNSKMNRYGLPLDNRADYTKLDWLAWTASLAPNRAGFEALLEPEYRFANESPSRVPLTDWYDTKTGKQVGFQARSVVGGIFIKMLSHDGTWKKYSGVAGSENSKGQR